MLTPTLRAIALSTVVALSGAGIAGVAAQAEETVTVGGAPMYPSKNIVENAVNSMDHETLVTAVKVAGLVDTLASEGPFTVFAPTDAAFAKLPQGALESLLKPENRDQLKSILTYHVVATNALSDAVKKMVDDDGGRHPVSTVSGHQLIASVKDGNIMLTDEQGQTAMVTIPDVKQSNGVIHVIDTVLLPKM